MVEFDVKLAADNVAFLLHDATLERTTSGRGRADALLWRELSRLDAGGWHSAKYAGEPLPTLASIARWARATRRRVQHRDQADAGPRARDGRGGRARRDGTVARRRGAAAAVVVLRGRARRRAGRRPGAAARAAAGRRCRADWQARLARLDCVALDVDHEALTADLVAKGPPRRLSECLCFTPNEPERIAELAAWGVDGIITDAVDRVPADSLTPPLPLP